MKTIIIGAACLAAGLAMWLAATSYKARHRINDATAKQIKEGMTLSQVETLFRVPAGDYTTKRVVFLSPPALSISDLTVMARDGLSHS